MPLDHFSLQVPQSSFDPLITFLTTSLGHFGFKEHVRPVPYVAGIGDKIPYMWIAGVELEEEEQKVLEKVLAENHIAFTAENADQVREFHEKALEAGAKCNGPPRLRLDYAPTYYAAYVKDPVCGVNFEVVCHKGDKSAVKEKGAGEEKEGKKRKSEKTAGEE